MTPAAPGTPCLVVDRAAVAANLAEAARQAAGLTVRPHFKAHKCLPLLRLQLAAPGHHGVTCATAQEALACARDGVRDVLVANEVVDPVALAELRRAAELAEVTVAVDSDTGLRRLEAALAGGPAAGVLVDVEVGQGRCGLAPGDPAIVALARAADASPRLRFRGLMGYDGHAQHLDPAGRRASTRRVADLLAAERDRLTAAGLAVEVVSGAGSGTLALAAEAGVLTEAQAGSYVLLDTQYGELGLGFANAVRCLATVVSRRGATAVLDAGLKALSAEFGLPRVERGDATATGIADEHLTLRLEPGSTLAVGDRVTVVPRHLDPTMALHDAVWAGDEWWPVTRPSERERPH